MNYFQLQLKPLPYLFPVCEINLCSTSPPDEVNGHRSWRRRGSGGGRGSGWVTPGAVGLKGDEGGHGGWAGEDGRSLPPPSWQIALSGPLPMSQGPAPRHSSPPLAACRGRRGGVPGRENEWMYGRTDGWRCRCYRREAPSSPCRNTISFTGQEALEPG